jgi:hypothetical protein
LIFDLIIYIVFYKFLTFFFIIELNFSFFYFFSRFDRAEQLKKTGQSIPERLGARHTIVPVFTKQVEKRENSKIVPDAARGTSVYGYRTHEGADFLDFKKFHCQGTCDFKNIFHSILCASSNRIVKYRYSWFIFMT